MRKNGFLRALGLVLLVVLIGVWAGATYARGQALPPGAGRGMQGMGPGGPLGQITVWRLIARRLNLTPDQKQSVRQMLQSSDVPEAQRDVAAARQQLAGAIVNGGDHAGAAARLADLESQLTAKGAALAANVFQQVLTDAQRTQAKQLWTEAQQRQQQRAGRAGRQRG